MGDAASKVPAKELSKEEQVKKYAEAYYSTLFVRLPPPMAGSDTDSVDLYEL